MDDIVKRLRHRDLNCSPEDYHSEVAADEIERLRTQRQSDV